MNWSCSFGRKGWLSILALLALTLFSTSAFADCSIANTGPSTVTRTWTVNSNTCSAGVKNIGPIATGSTYTWVDSTSTSGSPVGSASYTCQADGTFNSTPLNATCAPVCNATASIQGANSQGYKYNTAVTLTSNGSSPNATALAPYVWTVVGGGPVTLTPANNGGSVSFTTPNIANGATATFTVRLTVSGCATKDVVINVIHENEPPTAVPTAPPSVLEGATVQLNGSGSYDPDLDTLSYEWVQIGGGPTVTLSDANVANPTFVAPSVTATTTLRFKLKVTDPSGKNDSQIIDVNIVWANDPPVASVSCPSEVDEFLPVTLNGSASHDLEDGTNLTYVWVQTHSPPNVNLSGYNPPASNTSSITFNAPQLGKGDLGDVAFQLTVTDSSLASASTDLFTGCNFFINDKTPPVLSGLDDISTPATAPSGAVVNYTLPAADDNRDQVDPIVTCSPTSGSLFSIGPHTVNCSATDAVGNTGTGRFTVTITEMVDGIPPVIDAHDTVNAEATSSDGAVVEYILPTASDNVDSSVTVICSPASGSQFVLNGPSQPTLFTTVTCNADDAAGNHAEPTTFHVIVTDSTAPTISDNANLTREATKPQGADVSFGLPTASDLVDENVDVVCSPVSSSTFAFGGPHTVTCTATDDSGNPASSDFTVTVIDTTPPQFDSTIADISVPATSEAGALVPISALPTVSDIFGAKVECKYSTQNVSDAILAAGTTNFPVGTTTVDCTATDGHGLTSKDSFTVYVHYTFSNFLQPVDNLPIVNSIKAGSAIPVKFTLGGNMGLNIFKGGYPKVLATTCGNGVQDLIEETLTAGNSSLTYDAGTGKYTYVWKTDKTWVGTCRQLKIVFFEDSVALAGFIFK